MINHEGMSMLEILNWRLEREDGLHGLLTDPNGDEGFLYKEGGGASWYPLGKDQNPVELMKIVQQINDPTGKFSSQELFSLQRQAEALSKPKA